MKKIKKSKKLKMDEVGKEAKKAKEEGWRRILWAKAMVLGREYISAERMFIWYNVNAIYSLQSLL